MKSRSIFGIVLTVVGVVAVVVAFFPKTFVADPKPGFGPHQILALIIGLVLVLVGFRLCCGKKMCGCGTCETKPTQETPQQ